MTIGEKTRNRVVGKTALGFESHALRQRRRRWQPAASFSIYKNGSHFKWLPEKVIREQTIKPLRETGTRRAFLRLDQTISLLAALIDMLDRYAPSETELPVYS